MNQPKWTFREVLRAAWESWAHEIKTQSLDHICQQAIKTLYLLPALLLVMLYARVRRLVVIGYRYARDYYFRFLIFINYGPGAYEAMRDRWKK